MPSCSIVIVNWNAAGVLRACIDSVLQQEFEPPPELIIVDNHSTDGSGELIREYGRRVRFIEHRENLGFAKANNIGARAASGDVLLFLNPDTELIGTDALSKLLGALAPPEMGLVGPQLLNSDGTVQQSCARFPGIISSLVTGLAIHHLLPDRARARLAPVAWSHGWSSDTDWVKGAAIAMRRGTFEAIGGWSEATFMYGEDLDLAYRVREIGMRVGYEPAVRVLHHDDHSAQQRWSPPRRAALVALGNLHFMDLHYGRIRRGAVRAILVASCFARSILLRLVARRDRSAIYFSMGRVYGSGRVST